jgi:hypothetical protein
MLNENNMTKYENMQQAREDKNVEVKIWGMKVYIKDSFLKEILSRLESQFGDGEVTLL